jgi:hypothetical protein
MLGVTGVAVTVGLARRRGWARVAALVWYGFGILQAFAGLANGDLGDLASTGLVPVLTALLVFYYLTRPHVAEAFGSRAPAEPRPDA